ncbi:MAG: DUF2851 family protein [Bacteroidetes bacterium]|nr:DUF2851 family protein [Bacteroidota bacterium]
MQEKLLQFIWRYSLYNPARLETADGETVTVIHPGTYNTNAGPDFLEAKIKVADTILAGHVELHVNNSDWAKHGHQNDAAYKNVILHVVYRNDAPAGLKNIPILELSKHIPETVLSKYDMLMTEVNPILCASQLHTIKDITKEAWLSRLLAERWEEKQLNWINLLNKSKGDWRNMLYWRMAANFGFKVNADAFLQLALSIPHNVFAKGGSLLQTEAILFGQAGMLEGQFKDEYPNQLKKEYEYLKQKYQLTPMPVHLWKFLRLRPANFPTIRIAQFAALIHKSFHLFSQIVEKHNIKEILPLLDVTASEYWDNHYQFDEPAERKQKKRLGTSSIHNIIINTIAPVQFLYAAEQGTAREQELALQLLDTISAEKNAIINLWNNNGWKAANAGHSQAMIQLFNSYCSKKRCLECSIGLSLLKQ